MLVIMENGDVTAFLQLLLNLKAAGSGNVLQIYTAEGACQQGHGVDNLIHIFAANAQGNGIHIAEGFE